jgi:hypothetical protein
MFPFDRPKDYNEMLNKIGIFTFLFAFGLTWLVSQYVPAIASFLGSRPVEVEVLSLHVKILYVAPAVLIALVARIIRLHNCISTILGVRKHFDLYRILIPLCGSLGVAVDRALRDTLALNRAKVMERTFYAYASFEDPKISKALVLSAIELWTWYWVLLELIALLVLADAVLFVEQVYRVASFVSVGLLVAVLIFLTCYEVCGRKADPQIEEIVSDAQRANSIKSNLATLSTEL